MRQRASSCRQVPINGIEPMMPVLPYPGHHRQSKLLSTPAHFVHGFLSQIPIFQTTLLLLVIFQSRRFICISMIFASVYKPAKLGVFFQYKGATWDYFLTCLGQIFLEKKMQTCSWVATVDRKSTFRLKHRHDLKFA
jgi:hypothetical protein